MAAKLNLLRGINSGPEGAVSAAEVWPEAVVRLNVVWNTLQTTKAGQKADHGAPPKVVYLDAYKEQHGISQQTGAEAGKLATVHSLEQKRQEKAAEMRAPTPEEAEQQRLEADSLAEIYRLHAEDEQGRQAA
jgi:hypothetical protein